MSAKNRFVLDALLFFALLAACNPALTGFTVHEWLSLALAVPTLVHVIINWDWVLRVIDRFAEKIRASNRINLAVDALLFLATVAVVVSGFAVSTSIAGVLGLATSASMSWHVLHALSANAVFALFALHTALHYKWIARTAAELFGTQDSPAPAGPEARSATPAPAALTMQRLATGGHHE